MDGIFGNNMIGLCLGKCVTKNDEKYISRKSFFILEKLNGLPLTPKNKIKCIKTLEMTLEDVFLIILQVVPIGYRCEISTPTGRRYYPEKTRDTLQ